MYEIVLGLTGGLVCAVIHARMRRETRDEVPAARARLSWRRRARPTT